MNVTQVPAYYGNGYSSQTLDEQPVGTLRQLTNRFKRKRYSYRTELGYVPVQALGVYNVRRVRPCLLQTLIPTQGCSYY